MFYLELVVTVIGCGLLHLAFVTISSKPQYSNSSLIQTGDSQVPRLDIEGWLLLVLAVTTPLIALTLGDNFFSWSHPVEILLLICGPLFICSFVLYGAGVAGAPVMDMTPIFKLEHLMVLFQVFGVIMIFNAVS